MARVSQAVFDETIAAIASPPGAAPRGIVRVSGGRTLSCVSTLLDAPRRALLAEATEPLVADLDIELTAPLGQVPARLYLWPGSRSYTREPSAEIHTLGCLPILDAVVQRLCESGARPARAGEFTLRAFLAGRLDLTRAEAVLGVIHADTDDELRRALAQLAGGLARPLVALRDRLLDALAQLEAGLDFADEDIEFVSPAELLEQLAAARAQLDHVSRQMNTRHRLRHEYRVVLYGLPNAGKSSLLNALAGGPAALVAPTPGTTRDYVAWSHTHDGISMIVIDTAGIDPAAPDPMSSHAQAASAEQLRRADLRVLCLDATRPLASWERDELARADDRCVVVHTKVDLASGQLADGLGTSSLTGEGLDQLRTRLRQAFDDLPAGGEVVSDTAIRCRDSIRRAARAVRRAGRMVQGRRGDELVAAELRGALHELGLVVGTVYTDDLLDRIFSRFCIGK